MSEEINFNQDEKDVVLWNHLLSEHQGFRHLKKKKKT